MTITGKAASLPVATQNLLAGWRTSPRKSYDSLPDVITHKEIFDSPSPTLAQIKNRISPLQAEMVVSMAIEDVNIMFREDRRMTVAEIVATAKAIVRQYWYLKPEDIKKCFGGRRPKSFVLEGDSFLSWIAEYDLSRDNACEDEAVNGKARIQSDTAISHDVYMASLRTKAESGDEQAKAMLAEYERRAKIPREEETHRKEVEFFKNKVRYAADREQYLNEIRNGKKDND